MAAFDFRTHARAAVTTAVTVHFAITLLYLTPFNPIKADAYAWVQGYMEPLFAQNWELFGPNPQGIDTTVQVACQNGLAPEATPTWFNIRAPVMQQHHDDRLSSAARLLRMENPSFLLFPPRSAVSDLLEPLPDSDPTVRRELESIQAQRERNYALGLDVFARVASHHCDTLLPGTTLVRGRLERHVSTPFRHRKDPTFEPKVEVFETAWLPYQAVAR